MNNENHRKKVLISAIVAMTKNHVIGKNNQLPWHLPNDLKHFKTITSGHPIIMGRKTFESIGRPLPNRTNIIFTRSHFSHPGCLVVSSMDEALNLIDTIDTDEIFIIGGAEIYALWMPYIKKIYLTQIEADIVGDAFFPYQKKEWREIARENHAHDAEHLYDYSFIELERIA